MARLHELSSLFLHEQGLERILSELVDAAVEISGADFGNIQILDPSTSDLRIAAQRGFPSWWLDSWNSVSRGQGVCGTAVERRARVIVEDVERSPIFAGTPALEVQLKAGVRAVQSTPLISQSGEPIGMFSTHYRRPHRPSARTLRLLDLLARLAADIIERTQSDRLLRESENRLKLLIEHAPAALAMFDRRMRYVAASRRWLEDYSLEERDITGLSHYEIFPEIPERWKVIHRRGLAGETLRSDGDRFVRADGAVQWLRWEVQPWHAGDGSVGGIVIFTEEITALKRAEEALLASEQKHSAIVNDAADAIVTIDETGRIESVNRAAERIFQFAAPELAGRNVNVLIPSLHRGEHDDDLASSLRTGVRRTNGTGREVLGQRKDGSTIPMHLSVSEFRAGGRRLFAGTLHDLTERHRLERRVLEAVEGERQGIGQELHDGVAQDLAGIEIGLSALAPGLPRKEAAQVRELSRVAHDANERTRSLARGLCSVEQSGEDLPAIVRWLGRQVRKGRRVRCAVRWPADATVDGTLAATNLYRIVQEAVTNAVRHGKPRSISITARKTPAALRVAVCDDGKGIDRTNGNRRGVGLFIMERRAASIGGTLRIEPNHRGGTRVVCEIPRQRS